MRPWAAHSRRVRQAGVGGHLDAVARSLRRTRSGILSDARDSAKPLPVKRPSARICVGVSAGPTRHRDDPACPRYRRDRSSEPEPTPEADHHRPPRKGRRRRGRRPDRWSRSVVHVRLVRDASRGRTAGPHGPRRARVRMGRAARIASPSVARATPSRGAWRDERLDVALAESQVRGSNRVDAHVSTLPPRICPNCSAGGARMATARPA